MLEILEFIFSGFWTWLGTYLLLFMVAIIGSVFKPLGGIIMVNQHEYKGFKGEKQDK